MTRTAALVLVSLTLAAAVFTTPARPAPRSEYPLLISAILTTTVAIGQVVGSLEASLAVPSLILPPDKMSCSGRIGTRAVKGTAVFRPGRVSCRWKLPPGSRGKILYGTISVTIHGKTVVKHFRQRIR
jgi:hypothetical protein